MKTHFAPGEKAAPQQLAADIETVCRNPVVEGLLFSASGLLAVLNEHRQLIAFNDTFMQMLGVEDPEAAFGLRPGEALDCIHSHKDPMGCGTTPFCATCGAAVAIVSSMEQDRPVERMCALTATRGETPVDLALLVRSHPIEIDGKKFILLFLQDITRQQERAALERTFFHDINNLLTILVGAGEILTKTHPSKLADSMHQVSMRLFKEIAIQRCLSQSETGGYLPLWQSITPEEILEELRACFSSHPEARRKTILFEKSNSNGAITTDLSLVLRILGNMVVNALEATPANGTIKVWVEPEAGGVSFCVWNEQEIPDRFVNRIFQRNFSTKEDAGRGVGTFSMKYFGEKILGGRVRFTTSREKGTVFRLSLPV